MLVFHKPNPFLYILLSILDSIDRVEEITSFVSTFKLILTLSCT